jgi:S1-C subfamily serine protease
MITKSNIRRNLLLIAVVMALVTFACGTLGFTDITTTENTQNEAVTIEEATVGEAGSVSSEPENFVSIDLVAQEDALVGLYENVSPGVVSILIFSENSPFPAGSGSGFVIDHEGHIVTNFHVVAEADEIQVAFTSGIKTRGEVIGTDTDSDLAVVKVDLPAEDLTPVPLGDSDRLRVGQTVVAIGNPFGLNSTMTTGIISSIGRTLDSLNQSSTGQAFAAGDIIQTDAAINPGNSGGPLLNLNGEVIGVNRAIRTFAVNEDLDPVNSGIGFAVSVNIVKRVVPSLIEEGFYSYPYLGISSWPDIPLAEAERIGLEKTIGSMITSVVEGGPADEAGLQEDDVILSIDGRDVTNFSDMIGYLFSNTSPGDVVNLEVFREGEIIELEMTLGARPVNNGE